MAMSKHNRERRQRRKVLPGPATPEVLAEHGRQLLAAGVLRRPGIYELPIFHDDSCPLPDGKGPCSCKTVEVAPPVALLAPPSRPEDN
jgi:hypothetical protein